MELPLPIAALVRRVRSAKSAKERHDLAYFAWEASIRLGVAIRPPADVSSLAMPSVGQWVGALVASDERLDDPAILSAYARLLETGQERGSSPKSVTHRKLFDAVPAYRNQIMGHGAVRTSEFYEQAGAALADGIEAVWQAGAIWPTESCLVYVETVELDARGERRGRVLDLRGPLSHIDDPRGTALPETVLPRRVYLRTDDRYQPLHPFVLYEQAELRERVLFFNGRRKTSEFLDYVSGERLRGKELATAFSGIEEDLAKLVAGAPVGSTEDADAEPRDGSRFGDYQLLGKLGEGGMGVVYLARQVTLDRLVALKMLPPVAAENPVTVARFQREIAALARCDHPNVIKILASGQADGTHYYTMELVEGADLAGLARALPTTDNFDAAVSTASERVRQAKADAYAHIPQLAQRRLAPVVSSRPADQLRRLVELFRDAARGVEHLHEMGILHRDLKPANLMVTAGDHRVVVMDLGLAALGDASESITRDKGAILGTLRYMPPEQLQRNLLQLDRRADVYGLGATFYELLVGRPLFDGDTEVRLLEQVLREAPLAPGVANPRLPMDVATIISKAIEKDPRQRYDTADAITADLDAYLEGRPITARRPSLVYLLRLAIRRHRAIAATVLVATLLAATGVGWFLIRERQLRVDADSARDEARASEKRTQRTLAWSFVEQGRQELLGLHPARAAAFFAAAYPTLPDEPMVRSLVADAAYDATRPLAILRGHADNVQGARFSSDGQVVVTVSADHSARIWDSHSGNLVATLDGHTDRILSAVFSPDGQRVLTASMDHSVRQWDASTGKLLATHLIDTEAPPHKIYSAAFSPDAERVVTTTFVVSNRGIFDLGHTTRVWDARTGELIASLEGHTGGVQSAAFSPDGQRVVTASDDHTARVWDARTGKLVTKLEGHSNQVMSAAFSRDGQQVVTTSNDCRNGTCVSIARIWSALTGKLMASLNGVSGFVGVAAFSPNGERVVMSVGGEFGVRSLLWDASIGELVANLDGKFETFSPNGRRVVTASRDNTVRVWDANRGTLVAILEGHTSIVTSAAFSPNEQLIVTTSTDHTARLWDASGGKLLMTCGAATAVSIENRNWVYSLAFSSDGERVVTANYLGLAHPPTATIWNSRTGELVATLEGHTDTIKSAAFSPDGQRVVTASKDHAVRLWDASTGALLASLDGHLDEALSAVFSPDGKWVVSASKDHTARLWDSRDGKLVATLAGHTDSVLSAVFSSGGQWVVTASEDHTARLWDPRGGKLVAILGGHTDIVSAAAFSPDGLRVVTASHDHTARLWDTHTAKLLAALEGHTGIVMAAAFSPDGNWVVTASADHTARVWDAHTGKLVMPLEGHTTGVHSAAFSPDGQRVVTSVSDGEDDRTTRLWDVRSGKPVAIFLEASLGAFSPDGQRLVTSSRETLRFWDVHLETRPPAEVAAIVAAKVPWQIVDGRLWLPR